MSERRRLVIGVAGAVAIVSAVAGAVAIVSAVVAAVVWPTRDGDDTTKAATSTTAEVAPSTSTDTTAPTTTTTTTTTTTAATTPSATTSTDDATTMQPQPAGNAGPGCVNGWIVPSRGSRPRVEPLDIICQEMGITGPFQVIEMR